MDNIEYYKSLISDEEVIKALIKESKAREGELKEKTRVRPNLNFFQRTVTNLVSSNKRAITTKELEYKDTQKPAYKARGKIKTPRTLIKEIVTSNRIDFVKASCSKSKVVNDDTNQQDGSVSDLSQPVQPCNSASATEKSYKENLDKYFVRATDSNSVSNRTGQTRNSSFSGTSKNKTIVFNLNLSKDRLTKPTTTNNESSRSEEQNETISDVISVSSSSSSSSSSDCEVIRISESDSD